MCSSIRSSGSWKPVETRETREAIIGFVATQRLLFVVHIEVADDVIRIISARRATNEEKREYESF